MGLYNFQHILGPVWPRLIFQNQFPNWSQNATAHFQTENTSYDVFLAHSGRQKDFVEQLYEDMTRHGIKVFFDKKSLEKGQEFPEHLLKAAATSTIAVPVLSEDFFVASSWPMAEIIASVNAKKPILYPLFYMISSGTVKDVEKVAEWSAQWGSWGMERHNNMGVEQWKETLKKIGITYGEEKNVFMSEVEYRKNVVACVSRMLKANKQTTGAASAEMVQVGGSKSAGRKFLERFAVGVPIGLGVGVGQGVSELAIHAISGATVGGNKDTCNNSGGKSNHNVGGGNTGGGMDNDNEGGGRDNGSRNIERGGGNNGYSSAGGGGGWSCGVGGGDGVGGGGNKGDVDSIKDNGISRIYLGGGDSWGGWSCSGGGGSGGGSGSRSGGDGGGKSKDGGTGISAIHLHNNNMFKGIGPMCCFCHKPLVGPICKYCKRPPS